MRYYMMSLHLLRYYIMYWSLHLPENTLCSCIMYLEYVETVLDYVSSLADSRILLYGLFLLCPADTSLCCYVCWGVDRVILTILFFRYAPFTARTCRIFYWTKSKNFNLFSLFTLINLNCLTINSNKWSDPKTPIPLSPALPCPLFTHVFK